MGAAYAILVKKRLFKNRHIRVETKMKAFETIPVAAKTMRSQKPCAKKKIIIIKFL
jgi:hypothetical protein